MDVETDSFEEDRLEAESMPRLRICPECGKAFVQPYASQVCCSDACKAARAKTLARAAHARRKDKVSPLHEVVCVICGAKFSCRRHDQKCCSPACTREHGRRLREAIYAARKARRQEKRARREAAADGWNENERLANAISCADARVKAIDARRRRRVFLAQEDVLAPKAPVKVVNLNGLRIERRGHVPAGGSFATLRNLTIKH